MFDTLFDIVDSNDYKIEPTESIETVIVESKSNVQPKFEEVTGTQYIQFSEDEKSLLLEIIANYKKIATLKLSNTIKPFLTEFDMDQQLDADLITYHLKEVRNLVVTNHPIFKQYKNDLSNWSISDINSPLKNNELIKNILGKLK